MPGCPPPPAGPTERFRMLVPPASQEWEALPRQSLNSTSLFVSVSARRPRDRRAETLLRDDSKLHARVDRAGDRVGDRVGPLRGEGNQLGLAGMTLEALPLQVF